MGHHSVIQMFFSGVIKKFEDESFLSNIGVSFVGRTGDIVALGDSNGHGGPSSTHFCCICMEKLTNLRAKKLPERPIVLRTYEKHMKVIDFVKAQYAKRDINKETKEDPFGFSCKALVEGIFYYSFPFSNYFIYFINFIITKVHFRLSLTVLITH